MGAAAVSFMTVSPHSMLEFIAARDHRLMRRVHNWRAPQWIRLWMIASTRGGDGWLWYFAIAAVLLYGGLERFIAACAAGTASALGIAVFLVLKPRTGRKRPCELEPHCWAQLLPPDQFSFPSGHSITAFAMATVLGLFYPSLMPGLLFCAVSIAISRIVLGMHFLSDVIVGSGIGAMIGYLCYVIYA
jgi:undecaprenyl-diphosphatase